MKGSVHAHIQQGLGVVMAAVLLNVAAAERAAAADTDPGSLPRCAQLTTADDTGGEIVRPWTVELDGDGGVRGHRVDLRVGGGELRLHTGRRGFSRRIGTDRLLIGERFGEGTRLHLLDTQRGCRLWSRSLERLAYLGGTDADGSLRLEVVDPDTRAYRGWLAVDMDTGDSGGLIDGECIEACTPNDGDVSRLALTSAGPARPVPDFAAGGWPKDKTLAFRWRSGGVPPGWAAEAMKAAASDATDTSAARSPRFIHRSGASNAIGYTGSVPAYCGPHGIACAGRAMPSTWGVWIRPHGTDYAWGTLRWCQKISSSQGCFDLRRVMLHELGHIAGLDHPSNAGFTLAADVSVMQAITPARPASGSSRHAFGRCDVATLQELYDATDNKTPISTCNDVATRITLSPSKETLAAGGTVKLKAQLKVAADSAYRQLSGNYLNARAVKLKYRRAGSGDAWKTLWMRPTYAYGRYELSIAPSATWEFRAVFPEPSDEGLRHSRSGIVKVKVNS